MARSPAVLESGSAAGPVAAFGRAARLGERLAQRGLIAADQIPAILDLQERWGCRFGEALIAQGKIKPVELAETLADELGLPFADLIADPPDESLIDPGAHDSYLGNLFLPWRKIGDAVIVACADPSPEMRGFVTRLYGAQTRIAITGKFDIIWTAQRLFRDRLSHDASLRLDEFAPEFSARRVVTKAQMLVGAAAGLAILAGFFASPALAAAVCVLLLALCYGANIGLRLLLFGAACIARSTGHRVTESEIAALDDASLPVYSILVPLYREAHMVARIAAALKALDYPAAKLDIKIVLEQDDCETIAAAKALHLDGRFEILTVPASTLRTKPRACNYAARFMRGAYAVIYDAEDVPEPDQLKKVVAAFRAAPPEVACFQARLNVYNAEDNWLTRMFALEYAAWFDFLLPGLGELGIPIPLGGTSNHFRAEILRKSGGWDAFNVTEDADLGVRLARQGYRVLPIDSSTYEEATPSLGGWIRQRSRWLKGYMQTALVHLRAPVKLARAVGVLPFLGFVVFVLGAVMTSLLAPLFWILALLMAVTGSEAVIGPYGGAVAEASYFGLIAGNGLLTLLTMLAPLKRRWFHLAPWGATVCVYWLLISVAAYKALWQLARRPFYWEKTQHGLARWDRPSRHWQLAMARFAPILAVLVCFAAEVASANPWVKDVGAAELIGNVTLTREESGLANGAARATSGGHLEYGLAQRTTLILDGDVQRQTAAGANATNFDNASAGLRTVLAQSDYSVLSAEVQGGVSGVRRSANTPEIGLAGRAEARLMFGQGFDVLGRHSFAGLETGWRWRGGAPADEFLFDMEAGMEPWDSALIMLQSFSIASTGVASGAYRRYSISKLQFSVAQRLNGDFWVQAGMVDVVAGVDRGEVGAIFGFWWRI